MSTTAHDSESAAPGRQVITACAFIHQDFDGTSKLFLPRRAATKKFLPDVFELPGGHIDFGEDIVEGLKREIFEEFEMRISVGDPFAAFTYSNDVKGSHSVEVVYFAAFTDPLEKIVVHPEDHSEFRWVSRAEVDALSHISANEKENAQKGFSLLNKGPLRFR